MIPRFFTFDVREAGALGGIPYGRFLGTVEARDLRDAKEVGAAAFPGVRVVVMPTTRNARELDAVLADFPSMPAEKRRRGPWTNTDRRPP